MTNEEKLKANLAAAKMLGINTMAAPVGDETRVYRSNGNIAITARFDLFTNTSDCLEVVKMLGETADLYPFHDYCGWHIVNEYGEAQLKNSGHPRTYEEAVAAAVLEVSK